MVLLGRRLEGMREGKRDGRRTKTRRHECTSKGLPVSMRPGAGRGRDRMGREGGKEQ